MATSRVDGDAAPGDLATEARGALERVCSGKGIEPASRYYSPGFVDHVNDLELDGLEGVRRSVALYKSVLDDLSFTVEDQLIDGNRDVALRRDGLVLRPAGALQWHHDQPVRGWSDRRRLVGDRYARALAPARAMALRVRRPAAVARARGGDASAGNGRYVPCFTRVSVVFE